MSDSLKHRTAPFLSQVMFYPVILVWAVCNVILPANMKPAVSMFFFGGFFGIILIPLAFLGVVLFAVESMCEGGASIALKWVVIPFGVCYILQVLVFDKTHVTVKDANPHHARNAVEQSAKEFGKCALDYFPMTCVPWAKNASLSPNKLYVLGVHPHGIHCTPLGILTTEGSDFDVKFPGLVGCKLTGLAATVLFKLPVVREIFIYMGYVDASRSVANNVLASGRSLFVCTGGEEESMWTTIGEDIVVLKNRKGFVRLALAHGASLVPIFGVGNSDLYHTYSFLGSFRRWLQKKHGIALPIFHGRFWSPLPYRKPIHVLVGEPIETPKPNIPGQRPSEELVDEYHAKYIERLSKLHAEHVCDRKLIVR